MFRSTKEISQSEWAKSVARREYVHNAEATRAARLGRNLKLMFAKYFGVIVLGNVRIAYGVNEAYTSGMPCHV